MKSDYLRNGLLELLFNGTQFGNLADDDASSSRNTHLYVSLHSAWPGKAGSQTTSEVAYTSYARAAVERDTPEWTVTDDEVSPGSSITFPTCTGGSATARFWAIGTAPSGAGNLLYIGVIGSGPKTFAALTTDTLYIPGHSLAVDDKVVALSSKNASLPTGIVEGTVYFVKTAPDANTITLSATQGGATLDISAAGVGTLFKVNEMSITNGGTPSLTTATVIGEV